MRNIISNNPPKRNHGVSRVAATLAVGLVLSVVAIGVARTLLRTTKAGEPAQLPRKDLLIPTQNIRFTIYPEGIFPRQAKAHKGVVAISIEDLVGSGSTLQVERVVDNA